MKILFISQSVPFPIYRDGLTVRVYHLLQEFAKRAECHLIAFSDYDMSVDESNILKEIATADVLGYQSPRGLTGLFKKIFSPRRYYSKDCEIKIREAVQDFKPDVVFVEQTFMAQYEWVFQEIPAVMSAVDAISLAALRHSRIGGSFFKSLPWLFIARQRSFVEKKYFPRFDRVTVVGEDDANYLRNKIGCDVTVVPNGVDIEYFSPRKLQARRNSVIFTGNLFAPMNEEACLYLLKDVFPALHAKHPDTPLVVVGRGATEMIRSALPPYVTLKENVADMAGAMSDALVCVSPIMFGTGIKNNVLQAMAMGIPVVVTRLIADPIGIRHRENGFVVERGPDFVRAILETLEDRSMAIRVGAAGRVHIENSYSWPQIASTYFRIFADILARSEQRDASSPKTT